MFDALSCSCTALRQAALHVNHLEAVEDVEALEPVEAVEKGATSEVSGFGQFSGKKLFWTFFDDLIFVFCLKKKRFL